MANEQKEKNNQPIIIIKKVSGHGGHHGGAWKVAFADFMTAMMAFFLVMWVIGQSDEVKQAVQGYFQDPVGFMKMYNQSLMDGGTSAIKNFKHDKIDIRSQILSSKNKLVYVGEKIRKIIEELPEIGKIKNFIEIEVTPEGLRIQLIDAAINSDSSIFFDLGSARLKPMTSLVLSAISSELGKLPNHVVIEGHTDSKSFRSRKEYSNWELSTDRANQARRHMEKSGLRDGQIVAIRGFADTHLRVKDNSEDARNRRVTIILVNEKFEKYLKNVIEGN